MKKALMGLMVAGLTVFGLTAGLALADAVLLINGAGATFPYPIYAKWADAYYKATGLKLNYQSIGSGGGIAQIKAKTVDFGASDAPLKKEELDASGLIQFPMIMGGVVPVVNLDGVKAGQVKLTGDVLADIFLGSITKWNDPAIAAANPGVKLPDTSIIVVHRSDGSGTTFVWTDYLSKVSPEWREKVGSNTSVNWPVGLGGKGNEGVSGIVKQTPNSIGYVELIYALQNQLSYGRVRNASGDFVKASLASVTAAASGVSDQMQQDIRISITNAPGQDAYPICSFTYLLIPEKIADRRKAEAIKGFLQWMLTEGQGMAESLDYARLPEAVVQIEMNKLSQVQ